MLLKIELYLNISSFTASQNGMWSSCCIVYKYIYNVIKKGNREKERLGNGYRL